MQRKLKTDHARQGETHNRLRFVLGFGLILAVTAVGFSWLVSA